MGFGTMQLLSRNQSVQRHAATCLAKMAPDTAKSTTPFTFLSDSFGVAMLRALGHAKCNRPAPLVATGLQP